jgi:hypothetical protein
MNLGRQEGRSWCDLQRESCWERYRQGGWLELGEIVVERERLGGTSAGEMESEEVLPRKGMEWKLERQGGSSS